MSTISCQFCDYPIALLDLLEEKFGDQELLHRIRNMEERAEERKEQEVGLTTVMAKENIGEFDVFLAHNSKDGTFVEAICEALKHRGLNPWLDKEQIPPGRWFQDVIQQTISRVKTSAVCIGTSGLGRWEILELRAFISQCVGRGVPVIPVLLPGVDGLPEELLFLNEFSWVRFVKELDEKALDDLEWGITGRHPKRLSHRRASTTS